MFRGGDSTAQPEFSFIISVVPYIDCGDNERWKTLQNEWKEGFKVSECIYTFMHA